MSNNITVNSKALSKLLKLSILLLIPYIIFIGSCSRNRIRREMPIERKMEIADNYFNRGKYNKAAEYYIEVVFERSSKHTPNAQFKLAESYFNMRRYSEAVFEYRELIRLFPEHSRINVAYFRIGEAYMNLSLGPHYSQRETVAALDAFEIYLDRFPFDEKRDTAIDYINQAHFTLLEKSYINGYIYYRLYDYSAALMYFDEIISLGHRNELDRMSRYYSALIHIQRKEREQTTSLLQDLVSYYPESSEARRISRLYTRTFN